MRANDKIRQIHSQSVLFKVRASKHKIQMALHLCKTNEGRVQFFSSILFFSSSFSTFPNRPSVDEKVYKSFLTSQNFTYLTSPLLMASERLIGMAYSYSKILLSMLMKQCLNTEKRAHKYIFTHAKQYKQHNFQRNNVDQHQY